jgi:hypothetical protein
MAALDVDLYAIDEIGHWCSSTPLSSYEGAAAKRDLNNVFNEIYRYTAENASLKGIKKGSIEWMPPSERTR